MNILLIDDLEENLIALEALLRRDDVELLKARSGPDALELLLAHDVALVLLDVQMPEMDGFELAELMRGTERTRGIPIIFLTAGSHDERRLFRGYDVGAVDFLFKPIDPHILTSKVGIFIELSHQRQVLQQQRDDLQASAEENARLLAEARQAEAARRQGEQQLRTMLDAMPQLVWTTGPDGRHDFYNQRWYAYTGFPKGDPIADVWQRAFHPDDLAEAERRWRHSLASGEPYEMEHRYRRQDGEWRWLLSRAFALCDEQGAITRWFGTSTDIHAQKQLAEFEQQLIGIVSHDLRNPLSAILMSSEVLLRGGGLAEPVVRALTRIERAGQRALRLVKDLLDLTKARLGGGLPIDPQPADFHALVREAVRELEAAHPDRHIHIVQTGAAQGAWDRDRIAQLVCNLVGNALQHGAADGPVQVQTVADQGSVSLQVHNTGPAIPAGQLPLLFTPYHRGEARDEGDRGSVGLGLYITQQIAEAHGGTVTVHSTPEAGTTFAVRLPLVARQG